MKALVLFFALALVSSSLSQADSPVGGVLIDRIEASVNSGLVLTSEIEEFRNTRPLRLQLDPLVANSAISKKGASASDEDVINFLIDEKLILGLFPSTDTEVEQQIDSIQKSNKIDRASLKQALQAQGFKFEDYFEMIRSSLSKRALIDREIASRVVISDEDVRSAYAQTVSDNSTSLSYALDLFSVEVSDYGSVALARQAAGRAAEILKAGKGLDQLSSGLTDLGFVNHAQMSAKIREQVAKLKIGDVSAVFSDGGDSRLFVVKLRDIKTDDDENFQRRKDEIRAQLTAQEYQKQIALKLDRERSVAFVHRPGMDWVAHNQTL